MEWFGMPFFVPHRDQLREKAYNHIQYADRLYPKKPVKKEEKNDFGNIHTASSCGAFDMPFVAPRLRWPSVQYATIPPPHRDSRRIADNVSVWGNAKVYHDRAFATWHKYNGQRFFYGDNRRL